MKNHEKSYSVQMPEEVTQGLNFKVECKDCKTLIDITRQRTTFNALHKAKDGQSILLTYFDCPVCQARHYVQADNRQTSELRKSVSMLGLKAIKARKTGKAIPEKQRDKFKRQEAKLKSLRNELMKKWEGSTVTNTLTGEELELHFTIC